MSLIEEISAKEKTLKKTANEKELLFFDYLINGTSSIDISQDSPDNVLICHSAFSGKLNKLELVKKMQGTKPIKGLHYTNNLIELIAVALHDYHSEKENLEHYAAEHSLRDAYLINKIFPDINVKADEMNAALTDQLTHEVLVGRNMQNTVSLILRDLSEAADLIDIYIIEKSAERYFSLHESTVDKADIKYLLRPYLVFHKTLYVFFSLLFYLILLSFIVTPTYLLIPFVLKNWSTVEPVLAVIQIIGPIILSIVILAFGFRFKLGDKIKPFQKKLIINIVKAIFSLLRQDYEKIMTINDRIGV